ncbi:probable UPF0183 protein C16orf70 homolog at N-terminal half [Coccomyxa sp. Obi]|nr:probable UPF0183 protein C16orf70 homolog at N-terminal half [Coccomyxa sp. Obi]
MLLTLELFPGQGLGEFALGMPLYEAVNLIRKKRSDLSCVEVKYATQALFDQDIVINFPEHGMHLRFEPRSQRLRLIEVYDLSRLQVKYGKALTGGASHPATFVRVYDIFGPTYPGEYDEQNRMYSLHYPGVVLLFPIPEQHAEHCSESQIELPLEFPDGSTPLASRICVHAAAEATSQLVTLAAPPPLPADSLYYEVVEARVREGLHFRRGGQTVSFGDSPQDVWSELGPPTGTTAKGIDTMLIHMKQSSVTGADYFYNYHNRGLDILFHGKTHRVRKFVLHTNVPGHPDFNVYAKCNFLLVFPDTAATPLLEPLGNGHVGGNGWGSSSNTDLTLSSREPSGSYSAGSSSLFGVHPMLEAEGTAQDRGSDRAGQGVQQRDQQDGSFWQQLSTLGTDLFGSGSLSPTHQQQPSSSPLLASKDTLPENATTGDQKEPLAAAAATPGPDLLSEATLPVSAHQAKGAAPAETAGDTHDGWDFDCEWDGSLISPDGAGPAAEEEPPTGGAPVPPTPCDQCWVGLGPSSDQSTASHAPGPSAASDSCAKSGAGQSPKTPLLPYPAISTGRRDSASGAGGLLSPSSKPDEQQRAGLSSTAAAAAQGSTCKGPTITADSTWDEVQQVLGDGGRATIHSRGFASNPFGPTLVYGYRGVAFEALKSGHLAGLTLFQA